VLKKCPYYYVLEAVMADRPGTDPLVLFEAGLMEGDDQPEHDNNPNQNSEDEDNGSSTSAQLHGEESMQVVDKSPKKTGPNQQSNNKARKDTISDLTDNTANDKKQPIALKSKAVQKNRIRETIMGSVTDAIEKQGAAKSVWKKEELEATKAWKAEELMLQKRQLVMQQKRSHVEVEVLNRKSEVEIRKMNHEAALLEEQKKSVMQDRLKKLCWTVRNYVTWVLVILR
jgi:hypothetical protein